MLDTALSDSDNTITVEGSCLLVRPFVASGLRRVRMGPWTNRSCVACGEAKTRGKGSDGKLRCAPCLRYFQRHGYGRPLKLIERASERRERKTLVGAS